MKRRAVAPVLGMAAAVAIAALATAADDEGPSILALMHREFTTSKAPYVVLKKQLAADAPDWEAIRLATSKFVPLAETLAKRQARLGDRASWERLTARHLADVRALDAAARADDLEALAAAYRRVGASCKTCHDAHKYRRDR